ncbi:MAG: hypothetical protein ACE5MK_06180, partial [Acidobacteriota bacterium]
LANALTLTRRRFAKIGAVALATIAMLFRNRATSDYKKLKVFHKSLLTLTIYRKCGKNRSENRQGSTVSSISGARLNVAHGTHGPCSYFFWNEQNTFLLIAFSRSVDFEQV